MLNPQKLEARPAPLPIQAFPCIVLLADIGRKSYWLAFSGGCIAKREGEGLWGTEGEVGLCVQVVFSVVGYSREGNVCGREPIGWTTYHQCSAWVDNAVE